MVEKDVPQVQILLSGPFSITCVMVLPNISPESGSTSHPEKPRIFRYGT